MTPYQIFQKIFHFLTFYVSYAMIIVGNIGCVMMIITFGITSSIISLLFWVGIFDIATIALTLYYRNKPLVSAN
jgi:hypothetical protein